jgi:hypothetical protein
VLNNFFKGICPFRRGNGFECVEIVFLVLEIGRDGLGDHPRLRPTRALGERIEAFVQDLGYSNNRALSGHDREYQLK